MKKTKANLEFQLVKAVLNGIPEKRLPVSRNLLEVDLIWPRTGTPKKAAARQVKFSKGVADFTSEPWTKRVVYREEVEGRCGIAVTVTEPISVQKLKRFLQLVAKSALKIGADFVDSSLGGYGDIAAAPIDAIATMVGEKEAPKAIAQGVLDFMDLPAEGEDTTVEIPLERPFTGKVIGSLTLRVIG